jgi:hypothetical protein
MNRDDVEKLVRLIPPPDSPTASNGDWALVEADLGTTLPRDWKALVERYGHGTFADFFHLLSPFFAPCTMMSTARGALAADRVIAKAFPKAIPFPLFPDAEGALPWAQTDNGDVAYWLTWGEPDEWPVAVRNPRGGEKYDLIEGGAARFLAGWLGGERACTVFPSDLDFRDNSRSPRFDPWIERVHVTLTLRETTPPPEDLEETTYAWRLRALLAALAPIELRGEHGEEDDERRQVHFVARNGSWRLTYDRVYGHNIRLAAPPEQLDEAKRRVALAATAMGCAVG